VIGDPDRTAELAGEPGAGSSNGFPPEVRPIAQTAEERSAGQARYEVTIDGWVLEVRVEPAARAALRERARRDAAATRVHVREIVRARIPGRVVRLWVEPGQAVGAGERLLAVEAMKMENEVRAHHAGTVAKLAVQKGMSVTSGQVICRLDGEG
jgi:biotin carboxyl carrier protein